MCNQCCNNKIKKIILITILIMLVIALTFTFIFLICCNNRNEEKSILTAIATRGVNTTPGTTTIKFSNNEIVEGTGITHADGSDEIIINQTGIYQISYQLNGEETSTQSFNFNAILLVNNQSLESTFNEGPVIKDIINNRLTLTSTVILKLNEGDILKLQGISLEDITYSRARIDIEQIKIY